VGKLVAVGISAVGKGVAVGRGVRVGNDVGVDGPNSDAGVLVGVGEIIAGKVGGVIKASSRGAIESK
jgi:F0F1-type ATP synthase membrane subunit c/vacuolar-type H+-ATPase subunit K